MKRQLVKGSTSVVLDIFIQDSSSSTGNGLTGLAFGTGSLTCYYHRNTASASVAVSLITMTVGTFTSSGFKEIDATNMPGWYQLCLPDAAFASGATSVGAHLKGAANMVPLPLEIELTGVDMQDGVRAGLTALPNAAAEASGGLPTLSAAQASNGTINANVHRWLTSTPNALQSGRVDSYMGAVASGVIAAASFAANALDAVWSTAARVLTAGTNIVLAKGTGVTGFNDLSAAQVNAEADTALADVGVTGTVTGRIDAAISTRLASASYTVPLDAAGVRGAVGLASANLDTQLSGINSKTTNLPSDPADESLLETAIAAIAAPSAAAVASQVRTELTTELARIDAAISSRLASGGYTTPPTANAIADQVWDELLSGHGISGSAGAALVSAESGGAPTANQNADALLDRADAIETGLTPRQALRLTTAALAGEVSGAATTLITIRNAVADTKARITASVDENGNRTTVSTDVT